MFQYSERGEVASSRLSGKVPAAAARARSEELQRIAAEKKRAFQERHLGSVMRALFEDRAEGSWRGHTDNYLEVAAASGDDLANRYADVRVESLENGLLGGSIHKLA